MPEGTSEGTQTGAGTVVPAWVAQLPTDLKDNKAFTSYQTIGDLAKSHLDMGEKLKEFDGMKTKLGNSIPKLSENPTPEERNQFFNSLGRPEKPEGYELEGGDKEKEKTLDPWKQDFHELGFTAAQAKGLKAKWDSRLNGLVEQHNAKIQADINEASTKLKTEWGDKYPENLELVKRFWKKETDSEFEAVFTGETSANRFTMMRFLFKMAAKTGEDTSLRGVGQRQQSATPSFIAYDKSPAPPTRRM